MKFQNYNEFRDGVRWHDYCSLIINEFAIFLVRRYDFMDYGEPLEERSTYIIQFLGCKIYQKIVPMK